MPLPPLRFEPILKRRAWGGRRLSDWSRRLPADGVIGESWDLADLPPSIADGVSAVAEGPLAGTPLSHLRSTASEDLLGRLPLAPTGGFPLLVKLLDAEDDLSVQVHPDPQYAAAHPECFVKNEAWFVLEARPGAAIYRGVRADVTPETFQTALEEGRLLECLHRIEVEAGDCVRLPSGICHALGAGVLVAEAQTPSDTTFRVWDWDRNDPGRPLQLEAAMACMRFGARQEDGMPAVTRLREIPAVEHAGAATCRICVTPDFTIDHVRIRTAPYPVIADREPTVLVGVEGEARVIDQEGREARLIPGDTVLVPAAAAAPHVSAEPAATFLRIDLPLVPPRALA